MQTATLCFVGGLHDGQEIPYASSPPPYIMWVDEYYVLKKWEGEPHFRAIYGLSESNLNKLPWKDQKEITC